MGHWWLLTFYSEIWHLRFANYESISVNIFQVISKCPLEVKDYFNEKTDIFWTAYSFQNSLLLNLRGIFKKTSIFSVLDRIISSQVYPCPNPPNEWIYYCKWKKKLCRCDKGSWNGKIIHNYLSESNVIIWVLMRGSQESQNSR